MTDRLIAYYNIFNYQWGYYVYYSDIRSEKSELFQEELRVNNIKYEWDNVDDSFNWSKKRFEVFFTDSDTRDIAERIILEKCDCLIDWTVSIGGRIKVYSLNEDLIRTLSQRLGSSAYYENENILDDKIVYVLDIYVNASTLEKAIYRIIK